MTIITNDDEDDDDNSTNINDYSVILLKVYFLCFVATELFFPPSLPLFLKKKKEFCKGSCDPLLNRSYWLTHVDVDELYRFFFACSPCIAMSLLSLNYSICIDLFDLICFIFFVCFFFWTNHFLEVWLRPRCWRGRSCALLYRFMRFLLVFWELYSNTFQVCIEKHSSHLSHVDLERCISPPSLPSQFEIQIQEKEKKKNNYLHHHWFGFSFPFSFLFFNLSFSLQVNAFVLLFLPLL